jgi:hypothetical protein
MWALQSSFSRELCLKGEYGATEPCIYKRFQNVQQQRKLYKIHKTLCRLSIPTARLRVNSLSLHLRPPLPHCP